MKYIEANDKNIPFYLNVLVFLYYKNILKEKNHHTKFILYIKIILYMLKAYWKNLYMFLHIIPTAYIIQGYF